MLNQLKVIQTTKNQTELYYTPELKELRLGFEYEEKDGCCWKKVIVDDTYKLEWLFDLCKNHKGSCLSNIVRVKYLNQADIESLEFEYKADHDIFEYYEKITTSIKNYNGIQSNCLQLKHSKNFNSYTLFVKMGDIWKTLFRGKIKNKLELQELLEKII